MLKKTLFFVKRHEYKFIFLIFLPLLFINNRSSHDWGGDFAQYINQAKCICEGKNQSETGYIFNDQNPYLGPPTYPIGFPLLLTPVYCLFGNNILAFTILISLISYLLSILLYRLNRLYFNVFISIIITIAFIYNPWFINFKASVLSDIPFTLFFILSVYFYLKRFNDEKLQIRNSVILGFLICYSMLIKNIGVVLLLSVFADKTIHSLRDQKLSVNYFLNPIIILLSTITFYTILNFWAFPSKVEHYSFFSTLFNFNDILSVIERSYNYYFVLMKNYFSEDIVLSAITIVFFIYGFLKKILNNYDVIDFIFIIYLIIIFLFPESTQGFRYILPIYPIIIIYILFGIGTIKIGLESVKNIIAILVSFLLIINYFNNIQSVVKSQKKVLGGPQTDYSQEAFNYIVNNTEPDAVFAFIKPRVLALYASRRSVGIGICNNLSDIDEKFAEIGVSYIVTVDDKSNILFDNYINYYSSKLELVWQNERFKVYRIID